MHFQIFTIAVLLGSFQLHAQCRDKNWQSVELGRTGDLMVRLCVQSQASLADEDWIAIEFENRGTSPIEIELAQYRISSKRHDLKTGKLLSSGGMASGNDHDLFPDAWTTTPVSPRTVNPGAHRMSDHPSLYSSALLGLPAKDGWLVKAEVWIDLRTESELRRFGPHEFEFNWRYPDDAEFDAMRARLKRLLANPRPYVQHAYVLNTLLEVPDVAKAIPAQDLLGAIAPRTHSFSGRNYVLKHLDKFHAKDQLVTNHFYKRLISGDKRITDDLCSTSNIWQSKFLPPLINVFEHDRGNVRDILSILRIHGTPQKANPVLARRLSAALTKRGFLAALESSKTAPSAVGEHLAIFAKTHDHDMVHKLIPFLDDKTQILDPVHLSIPYFRLPPLRVCDGALEAILTILDGGVGDAYPKRRAEQGFFVEPESLQESAENITAVRDKMIVALKQRLSAETGSAAIK